MATALFASDLSEPFQAAFPFPHAVIDGAVDDELLRASRAEIVGQAIPAERNSYGTLRKRRLSNYGEMGPATCGLVDRFHSRDFLSWLEELTGISGLIADPGLEGGGVHQIVRGGYLKVHADFGWSKRLQLHRRLNLLLYLNEGWREEWGGALEFWGRDMKACAKRIAPLFNRMVIFATDATSFHGHPEPLACPDGTTRNSIALYYYTEAAPGAARPTDLTDFRERPGERFGSLKHKLHQAMLRHPWLKRFRDRATDQPMACTTDGDNDPTHVRALEVVPAPASTDPRPAPARTG